MHFTLGALIPMASRGRILCLHKNHQQGHIFKHLSSAGESVSAYVELSVCGAQLAEINPRHLVLRLLYQDHSPTLLCFLTHKDVNKQMWTVFLLP